ncbi:MAG TPA: BON domain-containing protein [Steroidobacteraceae bacterium]|nr:BON domain-containing protein [Steroidobacteraceae bacterium]
MLKNTAALALAVVFAAGAVACSSNPEKDEGPVQSAASNAGRVVDDSAITAKVKAALVGDPQTKAHQINVETFQGTVQLSGFVDSADARARALEVARNVDGVKEVKDGLEIRGST